MQWLIQRCAQNRTGFLLALVALLFVGGWRGMALRQQTIPGEDWRKMAQELGSVPQFRWVRPTIVNHAKNCVVYNQDMETNIGFFLYNADTGKKTFLCEQVQTQKHGGLTTDPLGWSLDDSLFIYSIPVIGGDTKQKFVVCDGRTGKALTDLKVENGFTDFNWLSAHSFGYLLKGGLMVMTQHPDGTWSKNPVRIAGIKNRLPSFTPVSEKTVAWLDNAVNLASDNGTNQPWQITGVNDGQFSIIGASGLALSADGNRMALELEEYTGASNQLWSFIFNGTNYNIMNVESGKNMDNQGGGAGVGVEQWRPKPTERNQWWQMSRVDNGVQTEATSDAHKITDGTYQICCTNKKGKFFLNGNGSGICVLDIESGAISTIAKSLATNAVVEFNYSQKNGEYLLNCRDSAGQYLVRYYPKTGWTGFGGRVLKDQNQVIRSITWEGDSPRYARLSNYGLGSIDIVASTNSGWFNFPWHGGRTHHGLDGDDLYIVGNPENESPGIWDYNVITKTLKCMMSNAPPYHYAKKLLSTCDVFTNSQGRTVGYYLWSPAKVVPGKKYPIIFTQTVNEWLPYQEAAANAGYYFAQAQRSTWGDAGVKDWEDDVTCLRNKLIGNTALNIDTNQTYLWGRSAETPYLADLFDTNPALWKGLIIFDGMTPNIENLRHKKVFLITGQEADNAPQLIAYQKQALEMGVPMELTLQSGVAHSSMTIASERERTVLFTQFLVQNNSHEN